MLEKEVHDRQGTNAGLWLDKYLGYQTGFDDEERATGSKTALLTEVADTLVPDGYQVAFQGREKLLTFHRSRVRVATAEVIGRLVVGLGAKGPAEGGIHLEHTWGVPVLPGSSLKGLAAAAAHQLVKDEGWSKPKKDEKRDPTFFDRLFGTTDEQGMVVFHDAWWIPDGASKLPLDLDVMTVHHPDYYSNKGVPPSDTDSPNPVSFVTARGSYLVILEGEPEWTEAAMLLLENGLEELGLGAKTNAGYGRMRMGPRISPEERRLAQARQRSEPLAAGIVKRFNGAGSVGPVFADFAKAAREGCPEELLMKMGKGLFEKNPRFWKEWQAKSHRTPEERELCAKYFKKG